MKLLPVDDTFQMTSHVTSVTEALHLARSVTMIIPQNVRTIIAEAVIGVPPRMAAWILGMLPNNLSMISAIQLKVIEVVHLLSVIKTTASRAPATQAQIFSSPESIPVSPKQKCLVSSRNMATSKVVLS